MLEVYNSSANHLISRFTEPTEPGVVLKMGLLYKRLLHMRNIVRELNLLKSSKRKLLLNRNLEVYKDGLFRICFKINSFLSFKVCAGFCFKTTL
jgi:hypothetical protein